MLHGLFIAEQVACGPCSLPNMCARTGPSRVHRLTIS